MASVMNRAAPVGELARVAPRVAAGKDFRRGRPPQVRTERAERLVRCRVPSELHAALVADGDHNCRTIGAQIEFILRERYGMLVPVPETACA